MTGYESKKAMAQDKLDDDDDTQVYKDHGVALQSIKHPPGLIDEMALTIAYQSGYYDGKKAAQPAQEPIKPVAWLEPEWGEKICPEVGYEVTMTDDHPRDLGWIPLVAQRTWVDLTDDEIDAEANKILTSDPVQWWRRLARAVLAKSKERNA
jgi:hypothetical protein